MQTSQKKRTEHAHTVSRRFCMEKFLPYLMVAPAVFFLIIFTVYPLVNMVYLSFFDYDIFSKKNFIGLRNYEQLFFVNKDFTNALTNTIIFTAGVVIFLIMFALMLALSLQKNTKLNSLVQRIMFLPHICAMLAVATIFCVLMDTNGVFNMILQLFNLPALRWINSSDTVIISLVIVYVWKFSGYYALILLSAIKAIPEEINEAAMLDDARPLQKFFKITLPMLSPQLFFLLITITMSSFKVFDLVNAMTEGGPGDSSNMVVYYIYDYAFQRMKVGYACAAGTVLLLVLMVLAVLYFKSSENKIHYQ